MVFLVKQKDPVIQLHTEMDALGPKCTAYAPNPIFQGRRVGKAARVPVISCSHLAAYIHMCKTLRVVCRPLTLLSHSTQSRRRGGRA